MGQCQCIDCAALYAFHRSHARPASTLNVARRIPDDKMTRCFLCLTGRGSLPLYRAYWDMRTPRSAGAMRCVLLAALLSSSGAHAAADTKKPIQIKPVSAVADTQASARRQGAVKVSGINWACSGTHCSASTMPPAVAAPLTVCQELAREVGAIRSFKVANHALNGKELQQCNSVVPAVASAMPGVKAPQGARVAPAAQAPATGFAASSPVATDLTKKPSAIAQAPKKSVGGFAPQVAATPTDPGTKPSGVKGTPAKSPPESSPAPGGSRPEAPGAKSPSGPVRLRTDRLTYTGLGSAVGPPAFSPVRLRAESLSYTGMGTASGSVPFTPVRIRTGTLTYTGTRGP